MVPTRAMVCLVALALLATLAEGQRPIPFKKEANAEALLITPNIMTGLLVGSLWLTLFMVGFCCLFQVQTPQSFEEKCLVLNKQY
mmetsp:Transcript_59592/g.133987  ORF Transcript_59592/g.133987 Transcript_59592/m.133987 type:complete len:85 (-) Transcript_59592:65-319(-)